MTRGLGERTMLFELVKVFHFTELISLILVWTGAHHVPYLNPVYLVLVHGTYSSNIHFNIIVPSKPRSPKFYCLEFI